MARIQWQPIVAPDIGASAVAAQAQAGQALNQAFSGFTNVLDQYEGQRREANQVELLMRQNAFAGTNDVAGYSADLADGDLLKGLSFLRAGDIAGARGFTNELRTGRNAEASFARGQVLQGREDQAYTRGEEDRASGIIVAREANAVRQALSNPNLPPQEREALTARLGTLAATVQNAGLINDLYTAGRAGQTDARANENWDRDAWRYANERQNREWTVQDRDDEKAAQALITQFREYGPNITAEDVIGSESYKNASIGVRASVLAAFQGAGSGGGSFAGDPAAGGGAGSFAGPADMQQHHSDVASVLSGGGLSNHVVAGFLGNFEVEGGYGGALGDSGTASGIAQWRGGRRTAFQQRFGKEPHQATASEQAQFVLWELNTPEGRRVAGITEAQANLIKNAPDARVAAERIDQFYERSNGQHRSRRADAAARFSVPSASQVQGQGTDLAVGAAVTRATDPMAAQARTIFAGLTDDSSMTEVVRRVTSAGGEGQSAGVFAGLPANEMGRIIREVQDRYNREHPGARLPAAAAAALAESAVTPFDARKDIWRGLTGRARGVGNTGGFFGSTTNTINWDQVDAGIARLANGGRGLAEDVRNNENTQALVAQGTQGRAQLEAARSALAAQEARDLATGQSNNPATARLRRQVLTLSQQWGAQSEAGETFLQNYGVPAPRTPVSSGPQRSFVLPTTARPQQSRYIPQ